MHTELFDELAGQGITVTAGQMGENIVTRGIDLLGLPRGTQLHMGEAVIEVTGLRNPCSKRTDGSLHRKTGVMAIVLQGGDVQAGDTITAIFPDKPFKPLEPV
jgi:MOSC domain-containing protein YiiM